MRKTFLLFMMFIATSLLLNSCSNDEFELENLESNKKLSLKEFSDYVKSDSEKFFFKKH